jgi:hypothetical protein
VPSAAFLNPFPFFSAHKTLREMSVSTANKTEKMGHNERYTNGDTNGDTIPDHVIVQGIRYEPVTEQRKPYISSKGSKLLHPGTWSYLLRSTIDLANLRQAPPVSTSRLPPNHRTAPPRMGGQRSMPTRRCYNNIATSSIRIATG